MFARVLALLPLALLVSASHLEARSACNSGSVNCCNMQTYQNILDQFPDIGANLVDLAVPVDALLGVNCSPIGAGVLGGSSCTQQTVCCDDNSFNGVVSVGCTPINVNL